MQFQKNTLLLPIPLNFADVSIFCVCAKNQHFLAEILLLLKAIA